MAAEVPSGVGADRDFEMQVPDTPEIVTIFIDLGNENAIEPIASSRWLDRNHTARIRCIVLRPEVEQLQRIVNSQKTNAWPPDIAIRVRWNARELDIGRRDQCMVSDGRNDAGRRLLAVENPRRQGGEERPHRP